MAGSDSLRNAVARGFFVVFLVVPIVAYASDPDIPRMLVDAQRGSIKQQMELGAAYFTGSGVPQDEKRAAYWYEKAANAGDPGAQKQIGYFYELGIGVPRDPSLAVRWFERAAAGGLISAKVNLGIAYLIGDGVKKDPAFAESLFRQAYKKGSGMAACYLGEMYFNGLGVQRDEAAGEHWFEAGVKLHDPRAEFQLAILLWHRQNNVAEIKQAVKLLHEAAGAGMILAKHQLAVILIKRPEMTSSQEEVPALLKEASEAGEWRSSVALGMLSRDGMSGVSVDPKLAYYYYRLAALQGGEEALTVVGGDLDVICMTLGREQAVAIDADARSFFQNHHLALQFVNKDGPKSREYPAYATGNSANGVHAWQLNPMDPLAEYMQGRTRMHSAN